MHFNAARIAHKDDDETEEPFDPKNVTTPYFEHKRHAKSVAFAKQVSTRARFYFFSSLPICRSAWIRPVDIKVRRDGGGRAGTAFRTSPLQHLMIYILIFPIIFSSK